MEELLYLAAGLALGACLGRRRKPARSFSVRPEPLPCAMFSSDTSPEERIRWLRWMADRLEAEQAKDEGSDDAS